MNKRMILSSPFGGLVVILSFVLVSTANSLKGNSWQKRFDRAFLQVDGVTPEGRFRSFQRALKDPELRTDVSKAIGVVREKGFGKGHPEFIELLWPEGTQARQDLEAINALSKQLRERSSEVQEGSSASQGAFDIIRSTQESLSFGEKGSRAVLSSLVEKVRSDPNRAQILAENIFRNDPKEVESPSYKLLGQYSDQGEVTGEGDEGEETNTEKKSFLTVPQLELRQYDAFRSISAPLQVSGASSSVDDIYTLKNMGSSLTEIFSYLELGNNAQSTLIPMTTPFFISDTTSDGTKKMFVKLPEEQEANPPDPVKSSTVAFDNFPDIVMATLSFPGICTNEEIKRQKSKLMQRVEMAGDIGWKVKQTEEENVPEIYVLQYNAPGTLPWRRMNEIAVVMEKTSLASSEDEIVPEGDVESDQNDSTEIENTSEASESDDDNDDDENTSTGSTEIENTSEANESEADNDDDENTSTTDPDVK